MSEPPKKARMIESRIRRSNSSKALSGCSGDAPPDRCHASKRARSHPHTVIVILNGIIRLL